MDKVRVTSDPALIDCARVHRWLAEETYWARGMSRELFDRAVAGSIPFGALAGGETVGFARAVTDRATFAYVSDVFVASGWRGRGVARSLVAAIVAHPELQGLRRTILVTRDAHALYAGFGFSPPVAPHWYMELRTPEPN